MRTFVARYPTLFVGLSALALGLVQYIWLFLIPGLSDAARTISSRIAECLLAIFLLGALRWWQEAGFVWPWRWRDFVPALPLVIIPLLMVIFQFDRLQLSNPAQLLLFAFAALIAGFAEETILRGIALHALLSKGLMQAVISSSVIFGLLHLLNLVAGADPLATAVQIIFAILWGIAFAAPLLYSGSIWPLVLIHALQDFIAFWTTGSFTNTATPAVSEVVVTIVLILPFAVYGVWLIRQRNQTAPMVA